MANVSRSALVHFSAESMFDLVNDVNAYPEFLPGCSKTQILSSDEHQMKASLQVSKGGFHQWFTTLNTLKRGEYIQMELVDGPFAHLRGGWRFVPLSEHACKIELNLDFEFSSRLAQSVFGKAFSAIATNMVTAFTQRAKEVYGDR
ncbi:type II toxin-antitoxin system RatA family toxin [Aliiglaciecola sp. CAU 1673]|uniref:type II toxin-antitoxin system RatA family toxin n=1 Tax=Aliiglaciecola sp. CAU 1673 TaxID=3032595 RepID=UPI0023DA9E1C|nr:type II toxin-antitoxin system RatA family toxin [Aliiglaciecola sp. CAU 1673]MDF2178102.1 type II toxin-antitoxin system RatA family toxin [Aliiglaciecola sp. CAU 1673]